MRRLTFALAALLAAAFATVAAAETIGAVGYKFKWIGPNDKIVVEAFDDPEVAGVACYLSRADIGGVSGAMGLAENPSDVSLACRQVGPIDAAVVTKLKDRDEVFSQRTSIIFKSTQVVRMIDRKRNVLIYLTYSDKIIEGSPKNAISVVPYGRQ
jgi:CreA protein